MIQRVSVHAQRRRPLLVLQAAVSLPEQRHVKEVIDARAHRNGNESRDDGVVAGAGTQDPQGPDHEAHAPHEPDVDERWSGVDVAPEA